MLLYILNILSKLFWIILGFYFNNLLSLIQKRYSQAAVRNFWKFKKNKVTIIHPIYYGIKGERIHANMARIEDVLAMNYITNLLNDIGIEYLYQDDTKAIPDEYDVILICSPKGNKKSKEFAKENILPFEFHCNDDNPEKPCFIETRTGRKYWAPFDESGKNWDIGLLGRYTDKIFDRCIFLFWGIHGYGTLATAQYIVKKENIKKLNKEVGEKDFAMLVQAEFISPMKVGAVEILIPPKIIF